MRNLLTRGGIEFLAVLLGISGSMYIDERRDDIALDKQIYDSFHSLKGELQTNVNELVGFQKYIDNRMDYFEVALNPDTMTLLTEKELEYRSEVKKVWVAKKDLKPILNFGIKN